MIIFILLFLTVPVLSFDLLGNITCSSDMSVGPDTNISVPYYWPAEWNENMTGPTYEQNQNCRWEIVIPAGQFAMFTMMADIGTNSSLKITDSNGRSESVMTSMLQPYVFVGTQFVIELSVGPNGDTVHFGFKVLWNMYPNVTSAYYNVSKTSDVLIFDEILGESSVVLTAETRVSLVAFPPIYPYLTPFLRITLVFDGPTIRSPCIGTLYQAVRSNKPFVSSGHQMTVFTFQEQYVVGSFFIIQDYSNVADLNQTKGITCWSQSSCPVTLAANNGPVAALSLNVDDGDEYVKRLDLSDDAELKVYIGDRKEGDDSNVIACYDSKKAKTNIPQKFNAEMLTFYLEKGTALVELAEDQNYTSWNDAVDGREGFITSRSFGTLAYFQDVYEEIGGLGIEDIYQFRVNVSHVDFSNYTILTITCVSETETTVHMLSSSSPSDDRAFVVNGNNMTVQYFTNGTETRGFYLHFQIAQISSASVRGSLPFLCILLFALF